MLPYIEKAKRLEYDLVILNPNQNKVVVNGVAKDVQVLIKAVTEVFYYDNTPRSTYN